MYVILKLVVCILLRVLGQVQGFRLMETLNLTYMYVDDTLMQQEVKIQYYTFTLSPQSLVF
jgi:hypothetical protein